MSSAALPFPPVKAASLSDPYITPPSTPRLESAEWAPPRHSTHTRRRRTSSAVSDSLSPLLIPLPSCSSGSLNDDDAVDDDVSLGKHVHDFYDNDNETHDLRTLPSYAYACANRNFSLLPPLPLVQDGRPAPVTPPASPKVASAATQPSPLLSSPLFGSHAAAGSFATATGFASGQARKRQRKRKASSTVARATPVLVEDQSENVKRLRTSPALKHLGIFTHAAFAEDRDCRLEGDAPAEAALRASLRTISPCRASSKSKHRLPHQQQHSILSSSDDCCCSNVGLGVSSLASASSCDAEQRPFDLDVLVSSLPAASPYPPTPDSLALPQLSFTASPSPALCAVSPASRYQTASSPTHKRQWQWQDNLKTQISDRFGLPCMGLGIQNITLFPSALDDSSAARARMTAVVHTD